MLLLVKKYGLSHVCALQEFKDIGPNALWTISGPYNKLWSRPYDILMPYNFPFLDIYLSNTSYNFGEQYISTIEFYYRGTKDQNLTFKNLFEYLFSTPDGQG